MDDFEEFRWEARPFALFVDMQKPSSQAAIVALRKNPVMAQQTSVMYLPEPSMQMPAMVAYTPTLYLREQRGVVIGADAIRALKRYSKSHGTPPRRGKAKVQSRVRLSSKDILRREKLLEAQFHRSFLPEPKTVDKALLAKKRKQFEEEFEEAAPAPVAVRAPPPVAPVEEEESDDDLADAGTRK